MRTADAHSNPRYSPGSLAQSPTQFLGTGWTNMQDRPATKKTKKKSVNLSVDAELVAEAKAAGTNLSAVLERALVAELKEQRWQKWRAENRETTESMNRYVEENGLPLRKYRTW